MTGPDQMLPPLREDLQILRSGPSYAGAPGWMILDPIRNRYYRISFEMFQLLSLWTESGTVPRLQQALAARFCRHAGIDEVGLAMRMLDGNGLLGLPPSGAWRHLHALARQRHSLAMRLVHNYLFFKIPLFRPQAFIEATWPVVSLLYSRLFLAVTLAAGLLALYLISRQWEAFTGTFAYIFTLEGAAVSLLSIAAIKSLHELGHAYTAHRFGCRVPTMGVAFMVMVPLLYTDVSDAWRLQRRQQRLAIDAAGVLTELCVAAYAALLWVFVPDGPWRSALFVIASVGWIMSLLINSNPFMRFDGYYILSDFLGVENLQSRAFRHMRWRLGRWLFANTAPPPETFPRHLDVILTLYAIGTTIYRIGLYIGIALLVYHVTIKILGIALFAIEIGFFMIRPIYSLSKEWWSMRNDIARSRRTYLSLGLLAGGLIACALPVSTQVQVPAMVMPASFLRLHAQDPGQLTDIRVANGQRVRRGDVLFMLSSPGLAQERQLARIAAGLLETRLARAGASAADLAQTGVLQAQLDGLKAKLAGLDARLATLILRAPFDGRIANVNPELSAGQWIAPREQLGFLAADAGLEARGYVAAEDRNRVAAGSAGWFIADDVSQPRRRIVLGHLGVSGVDRIDLKQLTSQFGGKIAVHPAAGEILAPAAAYYTVTAAVDGASPIHQTIQGMIVVDGTAESLLSKAWRRVLTVLIREAGL